MTVLLKAFPLFPRRNYFSQIPSGEARKGCFQLETPVRICLRSLKWHFVGSASGPERFPNRSHTLSTCEHVSLGTLRGRLKGIGSYFKCLSPLSRPSPFHTQTLTNENERYIEEATQSWCFACSTAIISVEQGKHLEMPGFHPRMSNTIREAKGGRAPVRTEPLTRPYLCRTKTHSGEQKIKRENADKTNAG